MKKLIGLVIAGMITLTGCTSTASSTASSTAASSTVSSDTMVITVLASGKADAILFATSEGYVLMDTGLDENKDALVSELQEMGVTKLAALIITHFDKDHVGGADAIVNNFSIDAVYTTYITSDNSDVLDFQQALTSKNMKMTRVYDTTMTLGGATFDINGADGNYDSKKDNNSSLITMVTYGTQKYLFMGDAEDERIEEYLSDHDADADFLKVPYHGYYQDDLELLFDTVTPKAAAITNSSSNPSSSDLKKTEKLLKAVNASYYETAKGAITVTCTSTGFTVTQ